MEGESARVGCDCHLFVQSDLTIYDCEYCSVQRVPLSGWININAYWPNSVSSTRTNTNVF